MRFKRFCSLGVAAAIGMSVLAGAAAAAAGGNGDQHPIATTQWPELGFGLKTRGAARLLFS